MRYCAVYAVYDCYKCVIDTVSGILCACVNLTHYPRLKLKTIVSLTPKKSNKVVSGFCEEEGIVNKHFPVPKFKDDVTISSSQVVQILQVRHPSHDIAALHPTDDN